MGERKKKLKVGRRGIYIVKDMDGDGSGAAMAPGESLEVGQECCPSQAEPKEAASSQARLCQDSRQLPYGD